MASIWPWDMGSFKWSLPASLAGEQSNARWPSRAQPRERKRARNLIQFERPPQDGPLANRRSSTDQSRNSQGDQRPVSVSQWRPFRGATFKSSPLPRSLHYVQSNELELTHSSNRDDVFLALSSRSHFGGAHQMARVTKSILITQSRRTQLDSQVFRWPFATTSCSH